MAPHLRLFPLLILLLARVAATASDSDGPTQAAAHHPRLATTSTADSYSQQCPSPTTMAEYGDLYAAISSVSHHTQGQGAAEAEAEAEATLLLASLNSTSTSSSASGEGMAAAVEEDESSGGCEIVSLKREAEAKDELLLRRSFTSGTTSSTTPGRSAAAEDPIGSDAERTGASSAWIGDNKAIPLAIGAAGSTTFSPAVESSTTAAVGFCTEGNDEERLLGSTTSVEVAAAAVEDAAAAAHTSTGIGKGAWGTASSTTPRSHGGKDTPPLSLWSPTQLRTSAGTSPLRSLEVMAMQSQKRVLPQKLSVMHHNKKQERHATPSYLHGGLIAILLCALLIVATVIAKRKQNAVPKSNTHCNHCFMRPIHWLRMCCRYGYCSYCLPLVMMRCHRGEWADEPPSPFFCTRRGPVGVVIEQENVKNFLEDMMPKRQGFERESYPPWFLTDVEEIKEAGETFTVLWLKNIEDCRARRWPKRRRVVFRHIGDAYVERVGEAENLPPAIEYSN